MIPKSELKRQVREQAAMIDVLATALAEIEKSPESAADVIKKLTTPRELKLIHNSRGKVDFWATVGENITMNFISKEMEFHDAKINLLNKIKTTKLMKLDSAKEKIKC